MTSRRLLAVSLLAAPTLLLAGCATTASGTGGADSGFSIVTSTSVYADLVSSLVGDAATVTAIIDSPTQDPHSYEASARDRLTVDGADLVILNGGGYDQFMDDLVGAAGVEHVITAVEYSHDYPASEVGDTHSDEAHADDTHADEADHDHADEHAHIEGFNEHIWYDPHTIAHLVEELSAELQDLLPEDAANIAAAQATLTDGIAAVEASLAEVGTAHPGAHAFFTEPVGEYLAEAAGMTDVTTEGFAEAVEEGQDVAPATMLAALQAIKDGGVDVLITNSQTAGAESQQVIDAAEAAGVPVVSFAETLPDGDSYVSWMQANTDALAAALTS